jgi:hypothetical protein
VRKVAFGYEKVKTKVEKTAWKTSMRKVLEKFLLADAMQWNNCLRTSAPCNSSADLFRHRLPCPHGFPTMGSSTKRVFYIKNR